jgi:hypothetical protein
LIIFQPFDTNLWRDDYKNIKLAGYGVVSFIMPTLLALFLLKIKNPEQLEKKWIVLHEIFFYLATVISIAFGNTLYSTLMTGGGFSLRSFLGFLAAVVLLGIFPIMAGILLKYNRYTALNKKDALILDENLIQFQQKKTDENQTVDDEKLGMIRLIAENEKDAIELIINDLVYIESADNYASIVFWKNNRIQKELLRGTLKRFESRIEHRSILRCHRSFIINLEHVKQISGNAQGYRLTLNNIEEIIPVARNYGAIILERLKSIE